MKAGFSMGYNGDEPVWHRRVHEMVQGAWDRALYLFEFWHRYVTVVLETRMALKLRSGTLDEGKQTLYIPLVYNTNNFNSPRMGRILQRHKEYSLCQSAPEEWPP